MTLFQTIFQNFISLTLKHIILIVFPFYYKYPKYITFNFANIQYEQFLEPSTFLIVLFKNGLSNDFRVDTLFEYIDRYNFSLLKVN